MSCKYILYNNGKEEEFTYQDLIKLFSENNYADVSDVLYDKGTKADNVVKQILSIKKDYKVQKSLNKLNGEPDFEKVFTPQTLIDSGLFKFKYGEDMILELVDEDYVENMKQSYMKEGLSETEAKQKAESTLLNWEKINEDAKDLHILLNSFSFQTLTEYEFINHLKGTKFENIAASIYSQICDLNGVFHIMRGNHKINDEKTTIVQNVNLSAKLNHIFEDIVGHIDNLVIDSNGVLHIYNYKYTSGPISEWNAVKKEKYRFQMALLKLILAYNGFDVKGTRLHIIPIRATYSDDFNNINEITIHTSNRQEMPIGDAFDKYEKAAKYFIKSNVKIDSITSPQVEAINNHLNHLFPDRTIKLEGINKSVDEWIKFEYSSKWQNRIKKVNQPTHAYEIFLDDEFEKAIKIKDSTEPLKNEEIRKVIENHLLKSNNSNNDFLSKIILEIHNSRRVGYSTFSRNKTTNRNIQIAYNFLGRSLEKYITPSKEINDIKYYDWDLIEDETLLNANMIVFKNNQTNQIDGLTLSNFNLDGQIKFRGQNNIMGSYIKDASTDTQNLINFPATFKNIEAIRTLVVLNELLPQLINKDCVLGQIKILSTLNRGQLEIYDIESLSKNIFQKVLSIVKKNNADFSFTNNFSKASYVNPVSLLVTEYNNIINSEKLSVSEIKEFSDIGFANLESLKTREQKRIELRSIIKKIFELNPTLETLSPKDIIDISRNDRNYQKRMLAYLYIKAQNAFCYYSNIQVNNELRTSMLHEYGMKLNRVPNQTYQAVISTFTKTVDDIAFKVKEQYNSIYNFTMEFYNKAGFGKFRASTYGDLAKAFNNLYKIDDNTNKKIMEFRNPYKSDSQTQLKDYEKIYLKKVLFEFAKIKSRLYGFDFNFNISDIDNKNYISFIEKNQLWFFKVPLEKASHATERANISTMIDNWKFKAKLLISNSQDFFNMQVQGMNTTLESQLNQNQTFDALSLLNSFIMGDGYKGGETSRNELLNSHPEGYWETNIENLLAHYLDKQILFEEFNKSLILTKGVLLLLEILGDAVGSENRKGIDQTIKMILDHTKENTFNVSIMEPESQKVIAWLDPFKLLVSKMYIAGNITSMFRDIFEGMWQNTARMLTKYQTDIDAKSLTRSYKEVAKSSFTSVRGITIINELCKIYRLSNLDVARISEGLTTSRGGLLNIENWMYSTLRSPDFLNRMVLFIAKCMKDGSWEAFDLKDNKLIYNWKKDKRYSIYADSSKKGTKEYEEQRIAYFNAIRQYNEENPDNALLFTDDLPMAYSNLQILQMRELANSIYGAYDKSMRAKYERTAIGITLGMFSTWMNGMSSNYFTKPGQYSGSSTILELERDGSGNLMFMDKDGRFVIEINNNGEKSYFYEDTNEPLIDFNGLVPIIKDIPIVIQGIWYTLQDGFKALKTGGWSNLVEEIWDNPMLQANLRKLLSDLFTAALFFILFKWAITPMYKEFKKEMKDNEIFENAIVEVLYKSSSRSYDGFLGPLTAILFLGENTNPPYYQLSTKIITDLGKVAFGDKTLLQMAYGTLAPLKSFSDTIKAENKK